MSEPQGRRPLPLAFGSVAQTYDRVRPPYFLPLLDRAEEALQLGPSSSVLDLAAGTGRLTRELVKRFASVLAVEPGDQMRALIEVGTASPGTAELIPADAASVDAVFVGEAFHWFDPSSAIREIARVLRPNGGLAVIYTYWWETEPPCQRPRLLFCEPCTTLSRTASATMAGRIRLAVRATGLRGLRGGDNGRCRDTACSLLDD